MQAHQNPDNEKNDERPRNGHNISDEEYTVRQVDVDPPSWEEDN